MVNAYFKVIASAGWVIGISRANMLPGLIEHQTRHIRNTFPTTFRLLICQSLPSLNNLPKLRAALCGDSFARIQTNIIYFWKALFELQIDNISIWILVFVSIFLSISNMSVKLIKQQAGIPFMMEALPQLFCSFKGCPTDCALIKSVKISLITVWKSSKRSLCFQKVLKGGCTWHLLKNKPLNCTLLVCLSL